MAQKYRRPRVGCPNGCYVGLLTRHYGSHREECKECGHQLVPATELERYQGNQWVSRNGS